MLPRRPVLSVLILLMLTGCPSTSKDGHPGHDVVTGPPTVAAGLNTTRKMLSSMENAPTGGADPPGRSPTSHVLLIIASVNRDASMTSGPLMRRIPAA